MKVYSTDSYIQRKARRRRIGEFTNEIINFKNIKHMEQHPNRLQVIATIVTALALTLTFTLMIQAYGFKEWL